MTDGFEVWIAHVFDHPAPARVVGHIAETFERSGELLARFSDARLDEGFWLFFDNEGRTILIRKFLSTLACAR